MEFKISLTWCSSGLGEAHDIIYQIICECFMHCCLEFGTCFMDCCIVVWHVLHDSLIQLEVLLGEGDTKDCFAFYLCGAGGWTRIASGASSITSQLEMLVYLDLSLMWKLWFASESGQKNLMYSFFSHHGNASVYFACCLYFPFLFPC